MITNKNQKEMEIFIQQYMPIKKAEKKQFGEVFTPIHLINSMLDTLPKELFQNPDLKWLDPTAGIGNFMIAIYFRLMDSLQVWQPDINKRSNHILENMLYMIEINETNVKICKNIFTKKSNIICKDFLSDGIDLYFDIIIGNPPFQDKAGKGGKNKLYEKIICKCLDILNTNTNTNTHTNSYLLFLVPDNLFSGNSSKTYLQLLNYHLHYIDFRQQITDAFHGIQQKICCFLLEKKDNSINLLTNIYSDNNLSISIQLTNRPINPIRNWNLETESWFHQYISLTKNSNVVYNRGISIDNYMLDLPTNDNDTNDNQNYYTLIYTPTKKLYTNDIKLAKGFGKKKIIFFLISIKGEYFIDWKGEYGVGPNTMFICFEKEEEGQNLDIFFKGKEYKNALFACKTCRQFFKIALLQYLNIEHKLYFLK
jgi:hypothetical protein